MVDTVLERWLIMGIAALMLFTMALLALVISNGNQRELNMQADMLEHALSGHNARVQVVTDSYVRDLEKEADRIREAIRPADSLILGRWYPLMRMRHAIRAITLADGRGNEWALTHNDSIWEFRSHAEGRAYSLDKRWRVGSSPGLSTDTLSGNPDPRRTTWYSRAVENGREGPVWSMENQPESDLAYLSMLVRPSNDSGAYHVLSFAVSVEMMLANESDLRSGETNALLGPGMTTLNVSDSGSLSLWHEVLRNKIARPDGPMFSVQWAGRNWSGRIASLHLNGTKLYSGVMLATAISHSSAGLWSILALLLLLSVLLTLVFIQGRTSDRRVQHQARKSDLQAQHLARTLSEKETLDREVHHRVKNNLQVISSLLNLQAQRLGNDEVRKEFLRGKRRIDSIALVHHKLYRQNDLAAVRMDVFLDDIARAMSAMYEPASGAVSHSVETQGLRCDADTSIQLGMVLCELLANCYQHAFPYSTGGHINIRLERLDNGKLRLAVNDNGTGFDRGSVAPHCLGLEVVEALAEQLDGICEVLNENGTRVEVTFKGGGGS